MTEDFEKIFGDMGKTSLSKDEKGQIRSRLLAFIGTHPVREGFTIRHLWQRSSIFSSLKNLKLMPIIIAIFILLGGSVSASAENSLPGDFLYPVKISVNEKVISAFKLSSDAKANWEVRIAERRLEEAEHIAIGTDANVSGDMRSEAIAKIRENFEKQESRIQDRIAKLEAEGNTQAAVSLSSKLEASLETHATILNRLEQKLDAAATNQAVKPALQELRTKVEARGGATAKTREELETKVNAGPDVKAAAEGAATASANKIDEVTKFIAQAKIRFGADAVTEAEAKLGAANQARTDAQAKFDAGTYGEAFALFHESARTAQEAKLSTQAGLQLQINLGGGETSPAAVGLGVLLGKVTIAPLCPVERADEPCLPPPGFYTSQEVVVYADNQTTVVSRAYLTADGTYRFELKPGVYYVSAAPTIGIYRWANSLQRASVTANQTTVQNFDVDTGIR